MMNTEREIKFGRDLYFISVINRDGSGTVNVEKKDLSYLDDERFNINCLSITEKTFIASAFNSYVVKYK